MYFNCICDVQRKTCSNVSGTFSKFHHEPTINFYSINNPRYKLQALSPRLRYHKRSHAGSDGMSCFANKAVWLTMANQATPAGIECLPWVEDQ